MRKLKLLIHLNIFEFCAYFVGCTVLNFCVVLLISQNLLQHIDMSARDGFFFVLHMVSSLVWLLNWIAAYCKVIKYILRLLFILLLLLRNLANMFKRVEGFCNSYKDTCNRNNGCSQGHDIVMIITDFFFLRLFGLWMFSTIVQYWIGCMYLFL
jgi:hypothetical protein